MSGAASQPALLVEQLSFTFPGRERTTLEDVTFSLEAGTSTLLAGATGSGKTTLLRAIARLLPSTGVASGEIRLLDRRLQDWPRSQLAAAVGLIQQSTDDQICATTIDGEIAFGLANLCLPIDEIERRIDEVCRRFRLSHLRSRNTWQLSSGEKQRLLLAAIVAMRPRVLLLDEPLGQLDPRSALELLDTLDELRRDGVTVVTAEHRLSELLPHVDRVVTIAGGRLVGNAAVRDGDQVATALRAAGLALPDVPQLGANLGVGWTPTAAAFLESAKGIVSRQKEVVAKSSGSLHEPVLTAANLAFRYPGNDEPLWKDVSLSLGKSEFVALVGPNGSGKTTLLDVLAGEREPTGGLISRPDSPTRGVSLVMQNPDLMLFATDVTHELAFGPRQAGVASDEVRQLVQQGADNFALHDLLDEPTQALSRGQRLRVAVAAMLAARPRVLLLDEPTTGQDHEQVECVLRTLKVAVDQHQLDAILFSTHDLGLVVEHATRVLVLAEGRLLADCSPLDLIADDALLVRAGLHRTPLLEVRHRLGLAGHNVAELTAELRR